MWNRSSPTFRLGLAGPGIRHSDGETISCTGKSSLLQLRLSGSARGLHTLLSPHSIIGITRTSLPTSEVVNHCFLISYDCYISPDKMVTCLSAMTRLMDLSFHIRRPLIEGPESRLLHILTSLLTRFHFDGISEYFEDLNSNFSTKLFNRSIFDIQGLC
jgi:hypothetical protein